MPASPGKFDVVPPEIRERLGWIYGLDPKQLSLELLGVDFLRQSELVEMVIDAAS